MRRLPFACVDGRRNGSARDPALGLEGYFSRRLCRRACLAAGDPALARAARSVQQFGGLTVGAETVRRRGAAEGQRRAAWPPTRAALAATLARAVGERAFPRDAGQAHTLAGWRDMPLACFGTQPLGPPAEVAEWDRRELPVSAAPTLFAAIEPIEEFPKRWRPQAVPLGRTDPAAVHALGDGAAGMGKAVDSPFPKGRQTLDVYPGSEHLGTARKALYGEATPAARARFEHGRALGWEKGGPGVCDDVAGELTQGDTPERRTPREELLEYFAKHTGRLDYRTRLAEGGPLGRGLVEGSIQTVGLRLKARGARGRVEKGDTRAGRCCLRHRTFWDAYGRSPN